MANDRKTRDINITEITYGQCPPELTITFDETIRSVDLNKIILVDVELPGFVTGLKIRAVQST